ncbi:guanine deaminase [Demetria terragena]|uniref:guanine deaminase n=1 Tax=Demetria terragena TaxID=63959 RepID=UPI00035D1C61|nr:guanine deaminase [Demetria terragena]
MTVFRGRVIDTPEDPFTGGTLRAGADTALLVRDGFIIERDDASAVLARHPDEEVVTLADGVLLPGLVDTHVHLPQVRAIGGLGMPLLDWLDQRALPEEARLGDTEYACGVARDFLAGLRASGTTTALVFGAHFAPAMDEFFRQADASGLRITSGLVVSDRMLGDELHTDPERAIRESRDLADAWHGHRRLRYAVTPRFALSTTPAMLEACRSILDEVDGAYFTSHLNENVREVDTVRELFGSTYRDYLDTYDRHGLLGERAVLAHNVHPSDRELARLAETATVVAHCPTSNASLGSGHFPMRRHHDAGVRMALGSDVCAGTGFSLLKEGLQAYFLQQLQGEEGFPLTSAHLLWLATRAGALALGLGDEVGDLSVGKQFDAIWIQPDRGSVLATNLEYAVSDADALARIFALGTPADVRQSWIAGGDR